eukprot:Skav235456  [mRNA]  locus=scaffold2206:410813:411004:- [translate_table: standard]
MAPEVYDGAYSCGVDTWAWGVTLVAWVGGAFPFDDDEPHFAPEIAEHSLKDFLGFVNLQAPQE